MKQMDLWAGSVVKKETVIWKLFIDGASKNNPGPSGSGFVLKKNDDLVCGQGFYLGTKTNNQAEYYALIIGIFFAQKYIQKTELLHIISDSQLLVRQMNGIYKVKDAYLQKLKGVASQWLTGYSYKVDHVLREYNTAADAMANQGVEKKIMLPQDFLLRCKEHDIAV